MWGILAFDAVRFLLLLFDIFVCYFDYICALEDGCVHKLTGDCQFDVADVENSLDLFTAEVGYCNLLVFREPESLRFNFILK